MVGVGTECEPKGRRTPAELRRFGPTAALVLGLALLACPHSLLAGGAVGPSVRESDVESIYEAASRLADEGRLSAARAAYEAKLELVQADIGHLSDDARRKTLAFLHQKIALLLESEGRNRDALTHFTELVAHRTALAALDPGDRVRRASLAWAHLMLGNALQMTGSQQDGRRHLLESVELQAPWATADAPPAVRRDYAVALGELAELDGTLGDHDVATRRFSDALAILQTLLRQDPFSESLQEDRARLIFFQGVNRSVRGDSKGALEAFRESRRLRLALAHRDPDDLDRRARLAVAVGRLAVEYQDRGELKAAALFYRDAIEDMRTVVVARLDDIQRRRLLLRYLYRLADCLADQGDTSERGVLYQRAVGLADRVLVADPTDPSRRHDRALVGQKLGRFEEDAERYEAAWRAYDDARRIFEDLAAEAPDRRDRQIDLASIDNDLGDVWLAMEVVSEARQFYQKAYDIYERLLDAGPGDTLRGDLAHSLRKLAKVDEATGDITGALERLKRAQILLGLEAVARPDNKWIRTETKWVAEHIARLTGDPKP